MKSGIDIPALDHAFLGFYNDHTLDDEKKITHILQIAEKNKQLLDPRDKPKYLKNRRLINAQLDKFLNLFDIDDVITVKADLLLFEESNEDSSEDSMSSDEDKIIKKSILTKIKQPDQEREKNIYARSKVTLKSPEGETKILYFEHNPDKTYLEGGTARVKKVFDEEGNLIGAVKIMFNEILAKNEARISSLLPDRSHNIFYGSLPGKNDILKWYIFLPWFNGGDLMQHYESVLDHKIQNPEVIIRLTMIRQAFEQIQYLHAVGLIIGDIHSGNFIINIEKCKLNIIDLASAHIKEGYLSQSWMFARPMLPQNLINLSQEKILNEYDQKDDIFALGITISEFFPDYIKILPREFKQDHIVATRIIEQSNHSDSFIKKLLFLLIEKMTDRDVNNRPSIDECLVEIDKIIKFQNLMDVYSGKINRIAYSDAPITHISILIEGQFNVFKKIIKKQIIDLVGEKPIMFHSLYRLAKHQLVNRMNLSKRQADRLRVTPIESLISESKSAADPRNLCRFSWRSKDAPIAPVFKAGASI